MTSHEKTGITILDKAFKYAQLVISDQEITTWEVKKQCEIFLNDYYNRQYQGDFEFCFCEKKVKKINNILKLVNCATGYVAGEPFLKVVAPFQAFLLVNIFGWRFKDNKKKFRYRDIVMFITRKTSKTFTCALILILLMLTEQEWSEFYSISLTREVAGKIKEAMEQILITSPAIGKYFKLSKQLPAKNSCELTHSFYQPRTAESDKNNAIRSSCTIIDEAGAFTDNSNIQAMRSGQRSVVNPLTITISTAYDNSQSILKSELEYDRAVLNGTVENERLFCLLYYANEDEKWTDTGLYRANPMLRYNTQDFEEIIGDRERAKNKPNEQTEFFTKSLNIWCETNSDKKYIDIDYWKKCRVPSINFAGKEVTVGVDLSVSTDLTSVSIMYKDEAGEIWCKSHGFLPEESLNKRKERIDYRKYAKLHYCTLCPGMTVDYRMVEDYIRSIETTYNCKIDKIVSDPYNALEMMQRLSQDFDVILLKQTYSNLSSPTKEFRKMVYDGKVHYERNELLDWCMSCATTSVGKSDDEMLNKQNKNKERIDLVATLIFCYSQLMLDNSYDALEELESILDILGG